MTNARKNPVSGSSSTNPPSERESPHESDRDVRKPRGSEGLAGTLLHPDQSQGPNEPLNPCGEKKADALDADQASQDSNPNPEQQDESSPHVT